MSEEKSPPLDLFGDPWRPLKDQRGRKGHKWSKQVAENVAVLRAGGSTHAQIADRIGLDDKTLRKYYSRELDNGPALAQAMIDEVMYHKALTGNVSAARFCTDRFETGKAKRITAPSAKAPVLPTPARLGKKEERVQAARRVTGLYATRTPPRPQ